MSLSIIPIAGSLLHVSHPPISKSEDVDVLCLLVYKT